MTATTATKARTTRKIVGSLAIIGAAAAVAGLGTFGTFTDSTTPLNATVQTGTLSLDLNAANSTATLPLNASNFVPGDRISRSFDLVNSGQLAFAGITLGTTANSSNLLTSDTRNGLQLSVQSCPTSWTETKTGSGSTAAATYACASPTTLVTGPAVTTAQLTNAASLTAGGTDHLLVSLSLPTSADNTFQTLSNGVTMTFTGTQAAGTAR